jgi:prephenate dehydrogenase
MWHDICIANRDALVSALDHFQADLGAAVDAIRDGDGATIKNLFTRAKQLRDRYARESDPG